MQAKTLGRLALWVALLALIAGPARARTVRTEFEESDEFVTNPDCGWVAYDYEDSYALRTKLADGKEPFAYGSVVYTRHPRRAWEDAAGDPEFSAPLQLLEDWMNHGRDVAFRIYANDMNDLPDPLRRRVESVDYEAGGKAHQGVAYWDDDYIADHRRLVQSLARRLGDSPHLAFVDIGGVGNTGGEWFLDPAQPFQKAGLDDDRFFELVKSFVHMYREAFPRTRLYISYECIAKAGTKRREVADLLVSNDIGVRDDGLGGWPYPRENTPAEAWPMPTLWPKVPACFEAGGGGIYGMARHGKNPEKVLDWILKQCPPTYINLGGAETTSQKACREQAYVLEKYGRRLGYRLVLLSAAVPADLQRGQPASLQMQWANRGVAPCYSEHRVEVSLFDGEGRFVVALAADPTPSVRQWAPGQEVQAQAAFVVPAATRPGEYSLKLRMLLDIGTGHTRPVHVATKGADTEGRYTIGTVHVSE